MCSLTNPSIGNNKCRKGASSNESPGEDDDSEDQIVYGHDQPSELVALYQQRHQIKAQGSPHVRAHKEKRKPQETSAKSLLPPSAVEEAAWSSLTQANNHWRISHNLREDLDHHDSSYEFLCKHAERLRGADIPIDADVQTLSRGGGNGENHWTETIEHFYEQEAVDFKTRIPANIHAAQPSLPVDAHAGDATPTQRKTLEAPIANGFPSAGQPPQLQSGRKFDRSSASKGKQKLHVAERYWISNMRAPQPNFKEGAPIPLVQRLQELQEDVRDNSGQRPLTVAEQLQNLVGGKAYHKQATAMEVSRRLPNRQRKTDRPVCKFRINTIAFQDDIVDSNEDDNDVQGSTRYVDNALERNRPEQTIQDSHSIFQDDSLEDIDDDDDVQETYNREESITVAPSILPTSISERFRDALLSAPPEITSTDSFGISARLESVLSAQKSRHMLFTKSLQRKQPTRSLSQCIEVSITGTIDEAQLTACRCDVLRFPEQWNQQRYPPNAAFEDGNMDSIVEVIFSKISSGIQFHAGNVVRIHPPWQEIPRAGQSTRLIICTFFCEILR